LCSAGRSRWRPSGFTFFRDADPEVSAALREHRDEVDVKVKGGKTGG
jgi:hypothetical protein